MQVGLKGASAWTKEGDVSTAVSEANEERSKIPAREPSGKQRDE